MACALAGRIVEVRDEGGECRGRGVLGAEPLAHTAGLHWTEIDVVAPAHAGDHTWRAVLAGEPGRHEAGELAFALGTVPAPEVSVSVTVLAQNAPEPIPGAVVVVGRHLATTDDEGRADRAGARHLPAHDRTGRVPAPPASPRRPRGSRPAGGAGDRRHPRRRRPVGVRSRRRPALLLGGVATGLLALVLAVRGLPGRPSPAAAQPPAGCTTCHASLHDTLPPNHPRAPAGGVGTCLACHARKGPATPFEWAMHYRHYGKPGFAGTCTSCHVLDASGELRIAGADRRPGPRVTPDVVDTMSAYYPRWATSTFLDRRHADRRVSCGGCHGDALPRTRVTSDGCLACHKSYADVAAKTKHVEPNPHDSHVGEIRCTLCHRAHAEPVLYCAQCHSFELKTR